MRPPGISAFCGRQRARDVGDGDVVGAQPIGVEHDVDLPLAAAGDDHLADAVQAFELAPEHLVGVLGDVADRLVGGERQAHDRATASGSMRSTRGC